jgi:hypothetical protein
MENGINKNMNTRYSRSPAPYVDRSKWRSSNSSRHGSKSPHDAQKNYERYLALAQAEAQSGNSIGAQKLLSTRRTLFQVNDRGSGNDVGGVVTTDTAIR